MKENMILLAIPAKRWEGIKSDLCMIGVYHDEVEEFKNNAFDYTVACVENTLEHMKG